VQFSLQAASPETFGYTLLCENMVLRIIFVPKKEKVTSDWREVHDEELHSSHSSKNFISPTKLRRMRWANM
jgi:hypothetical protein